jgi:hypothetical protein
MYMTTLASGEPAVGVKNGELIIRCTPQPGGLWPTGILTSDGNEYTFSGAASCKMIDCSLSFKKKVVGFLRSKGK